MNLYLRFNDIPLYFLSITYPKKTGSDFIKLRQPCAIYLSSVVLTLKNKVFTKPVRNKAISVNSVKILEYSHKLKLAADTRLKRV